ncbi:MAG: hypothetical protein DMG00_08205 [Acidobacteria bacterium]|nr:MAG: hypothetical protein DMG00_08205 [Acidobacteriota bacterium]
MPFWRAPDGTLREVEGSFARYVDSLAPYFDEIVLSVPLLRAARGEGTAVRAPNVTLVPLPHFDGPLQFYPRLPLMLPRLLRFAKQIDLLHCRVPTPAAIFAFACARLFGRAAFVLIVGDLAAVQPTVPYRGAKKRLWDWYTAFEERNVQWMADRSLAFANGAALARKHSGRHVVVETRTTTIGAGDVATRDDTCAAPRKRILTVSRIDPRKGLRVLPDVVRRLVDGGFDVSLDIVGPAVGSPGIAEQQEVERQARALRVEERLRIVGPMALERLLPLYREYDLFVLPTLPGEGVPRVLLEAMAGGTPIVATCVAGIPGLITHETNGLLVDAPTADALADALARLIVDFSLRRRLIAAGYATARAHTLEVQAGRMMTDVSAHLGVETCVPASASYFRR